MVTFYVNFNVRFSVNDVKINHHSKRKMLINIESYVTYDRASMLKLC
jgi:hypothetical protein